MTVVIAVDGCRSLAFIGRIKAVKILTNYYTLYNSIDPAWLGINKYVSLSVS